MTGSRPSDYLLPEEENRRIFRDAIVGDLLAGRRPQSEPVVVFLVGQPGAGKSRVADALGRQLSARGGFVEVDSDLYKPYHPAYDALLREDDTLMAACTRADGRRWMAQAQQYVRGHRVNAIVHETSQDPHATARTMRDYRHAGFRVELAALGVSQALSNQGILHRYHEQVRDRGSGRLTVQEKADESYRGILDLAELVDAEGLADRVAVFRRGEGQPRYDNELVDDVAGDDALGAPGGDPNAPAADAASHWRRQPAFRAAIETERARGWTPREVAGFRAVQAELRAGLGPQWSDQLDRVDREATPFLERHEAAAGRRAVATDFPLRPEPGEGTPPQRPRSGRPGQGSERGPERA